MKVLEHRVHFNEVDAQGIVFNAHYLTWCDHAIYEFFRKNNWSPIQLKEMNCDLVVRTVHLDYQASARLDQLISIDANIIRVGNSSFEAVFYFRYLDELLVTAKICYINVPKEKSEPIPSDIRNYLNSHIVAIG